MVWTVADGANILPLYTTPQDSPSWHDVCLVHEQNKQRIAEAISVKKLTTQKFVKAVASKYHHYYLSWQTRLQRITQGGKINNSRDSRRRDRATTRGLVASWQVRIPRSAIAPRAGTDRDASRSVA